MAVCIGRTVRPEVHHWEHQDSVVPPYIKDGLRTFSWKRFTNTVMEAFRLSG
jgi:hypothetical protein